MSYKKRLRSCVEKKTFYSWDEAEAAVVSLKKSVFNILKPYRCDVCGWLHLTTKEKILPQTREYFNAYKHLDDTIPMFEKIVTGRDTRKQGGALKKFKRNRESHKTFKNFRI